MNIFGRFNTCMSHLTELNYLRKQNEIRKMMNVAVEFHHYQSAYR